jgi:hypothetical protein
MSGDTPYRVSHAARCARCETPLPTNGLREPQLCDSGCGEWLSLAAVDEHLCPEVLDLAKGGAWWKPVPIHLHSHAFSRNTTGPDPVLEYDWSTIELRWQNPAIVDPQGPPEYVSKQPEAPRHVAKGGAHNPGISGSAPAQPGDSTHRLYAGFRCVRTIAGPPPPAVQAPASDQFTLPFREPGYTPPGAPATDAKTPPKGNTP